MSHQACLDKNGGKKKYKLRREYKGEERSGGYQEPGLPGILDEEEENSSLVGKKTWNKTELLSWELKSSVKLPEMSLGVFVLVGVCQLGDGCTRPPQESSQKSDGLMMFLVVLMGTIKGSTCLSIN